MSEKHWNACSMRISTARQSGRSIDSLIMENKTLKEQNEKLYARVCLMLSVIVRARQSLIFRKDVVRSVMEIEEVLAEWRGEKP